jgi:transposase
MGREKGVKTPVKWTKDMPERAYNLCLKGLTDAELASALGVGFQTVKHWKRTKPVFDNAVRAGKDEADARVARSLYERAVGYSHEDTYITTYKEQVTKVPYIKHYPPDTTAAIYWLNNRTRHQDQPWTNAQYIELTGKKGGPIETRNTVDLSGLDDEELKFLSQIAEKTQNNAD